jgi:hypothetical protein
MCGQSQTGRLYHDLRIGRQMLEHGCQFPGQPLGVSVQHGYLG